MTELHYREAEENLNSWFQVKSVVESTACSRKLPTWNTQREGGSIIQKKVPAGGDDFSLQSEVCLQNHFTTLQAEEERPITLGEMLELDKTDPFALCVTTNIIKKK